MCTNLISSGIVGTLGGVIVGFFLPEISALIKRKTHEQKILSVIEKELKTIQFQLPQKISILDQMVNGLSLEKLLPGKSVHIITTGYYSNINDLYLLLDVIKRNCLHVIYERLRVGEEIMDNFEDKVRSEFQSSGNKNLLKYHKIRIEELKSSYQVVDDLITSYLINKPIDVFYINK